MNLDTKFGGLLCLIYFQYLNTSYSNNISIYFKYYKINIFRYKGYIPGDF